MITRGQATEMRDRVWSDGRTIEIPTLDLLKRLESGAMGKQ